MNVSPLENRIVAADIPPERLAGNSRLSEREKIAEASRQFETILLRQILESTQKTVITSKFADDSMSSGIYRGLITEQLADSISKSGAFGFSRIFEQQLNHREARNGVNAAATKGTQRIEFPPAAAAVKITSPLSFKTHE